MVSIKRPGELMKELKLAFSIPFSYAKHRNDKHETNATIFIDVDSAKSSFS